MQLNNKTIVRTALCAVLVSALGYSFAAKSETKLIPFQGKLTDASGQVIDDGAIVVQFKMYDAPVGGQAKWNGEVQMLSVNGGLVNTTLGTKASLKNVDFSSPTYLEITIDANGDNQIGPEDPPLLPRQSIVPAVYAVESGNAKKLNGHDWSAIFGSNDPTGKIPGNKLADGSIGTKQIADGAVKSTQIASGAVTSAQVANGAITSAKIAKNSVTTDKLAAEAVTSDQLAKDSVTTDKIAEKSITTGLMGERKRVIASETAAPVGSMAISKALDNGYTLNAITPNWEKIPNMSVKLTTSGRPVMIMLQRGSIMVYGYVDFRLRRDGTDIHWADICHHTDTKGKVTHTPSSVMTFVDMDASAGEHEYSLHAYKGASHEDVRFYGDMYLLAFEL